MKCAVAQRALSEAMDERGPRSPLVEAHAASCPACSAFLRGAWRLREAARFELAPPVPDLVPRIMSAVRQEAPRRVRVPALPLPHRSPAFRRPALGGRLAAASVAAGLVIGFVLTAGGVVPRRGSDTAALAASIPGFLLRTAEDLEGYRATFAVTERHWSPDVPVRTFRADVAYRAPESFRVAVRDTSSYPPGAWPRNDLLLVSEGRSWRATGPNPCPAAALPACPSVEPVERAVTGRPPFDPSAALPTDVIVPMTVLAAADRVEVLGSGAVDGRAAVAVRLRYRDALPLLGYLRFLGSWRPFFPQDRVLVWLDRRSWFPLRYEVFPAPGAERALWAAQQALPSESPESPVFTATAVSLSTDSPPEGTFRVSPTGRPQDQGFEERGIPGRPDVPAGLRPRTLLGLRAWRAGRLPPAPGRDAEQLVAAYARGLGWLTVTSAATGTRPFGIGPFAEEVGLGPAGIGYYEPASESEPRRVALHTRSGELLVTSNLPRKDLLAVAASLPVRGLAQPEAWRVVRWADGEVVHGLSHPEALAGSGVPALVPSFLPPDYRPAAAEIVRTGRGEGITLVYRRPAAELDGVGLVLHQATGQTLAPPTDPGLQSVALGDLVARWSPEDELLEWMDGGVYRSLAAPGLDLSTLLAVARSLEAPS